MKTSTKVLLTIAAAVVVWLLLGCAGKEHFVETPSPATSDGTADAAYLQNLYAIYNEQYFRNRLTKTPTIDMFLTGNNMATSYCNGAGTCALHFNEKFTLAPRVADQILLHEMCHIKTWDADKDDFGQHVGHGKMWRGCMLQLDMQGAFRQIIIDNYSEDM
jgi:predicted SprT family Zn-dependent metalloprotease